MSDTGTTTTTASAPAGGAATAGTTSAPQSAGTSNASAGTSTNERSPGEPSAASPANGQAQSDAQARVLAEADLDAYIEHRVNGKTERIKVRDALKGYGLDKTATQRMQEAAQSRKQVQDLMHLMKTDFNKYCEVTGQDANEFLRSQLGSRKEIAEEILAAEYERQQMSPEQRELVEAKQRLQTFEQRDTEAKKPLIAQIKAIVPENMLPKGLESATAEQLQEFYQVKQQEFTQGVDNLSNELLGAWEAQGLPKVKEMGQWMAQAMVEHQKRTGQSLQPEQAAVKVKGRAQAMTRGLLTPMSTKDVQEFLGEEICQKLRDYDVSRVTQAGPQFGATRTDQASTAVNESKQLNQIEWRKQMGIG